MADTDLKLDVSVSVDKIKEAANTKTTSQSKLLNTISQFKPRRGQEERAAEARRQIQREQVKQGSILSKSSFTPQDLVTIRNTANAIDDLIEVLIKATDVPMDEATKKWAEAVKTQNNVVEKAINNLENAKDKLNSKGGLFYQNKNPNIETYSTVFKKFQQGGTPLLSKKTGKPISGNFFDNSGNLDKLRQMVDTSSEAFLQFEEAIRSKINQATKEIKLFEQDLQKQKQKLDALKNNQPSSSSPLDADYTANIKNTPALDQALNNYRSGLNETSRKIATTREQVDTLNSSLTKHETALGRAFKRITIYAAAIQALKRGLQSAITTVRELDKSLTEQAMVTGLTRNQTYSLIERYQDLAIATGSTTKEIAAVTTEYMKQGETIEDSLVLTQAAVSAAKVARVDVGSSVDYLTTALRGFQMSAEDAMSVSDKFAKLAAASATDYDELAIALSKVASQANLAGMSMDYTLALLTQGLETTREAPETMGTALKTIIARMRELTDYGATLEGDADINTVESQLAYIGISLRDNNGELRSTQDVLDELGKKWSTLNTNQQAALAKALAGTRQQSRLIAMMDNYERVLEFQQMSEQSAGATAAQSSVYLQGMEAAINNVTVAWEKLSTTISDSDMIVNVINEIGNMVSVLADTLSTWQGQAGSITLIVMAIGALLKNRLLQNKIAQEQYELQLKQYELQLQSQQEDIVNTEIQARQLKIEEAKLQVEKALTAQKEAQAAYEQAARSGNPADIKAASAKKARADSSYSKAVSSLQAVSFSTDPKLVAQDLAKGFSIVDGAAAKYQLTMNQLTYTQGQLNSQLLTVPGLLKTFKAGMATTVGFIPKLTAGFRSIGVALKAAFASNPVGFIIEAIRVLTTVVAGAVIGITALVEWIQESQPTAENAAKKINELNNEIYTLNDTANTISSSIKTFEELDDKLIKTKEDAEDMTDALNEAYNKLTEEEQEVYNRLDSNEKKIEYLQQLTTEKNAEAAKKQQEELSYYNNLSYQEQNRFIKNMTAEAVNARSAISSIINDSMYDAINETTELGSATSQALQEVGDNIISNIDDFRSIAAYANEGFGATLAEWLETAEKIAVQVDGVTQQLNSVEVLTSDDYSLKDRVNAYQAIADALSGNQEILDSFKESYQEYELFQQLGEDVLDFIDATNLSIDEINTLYAAWKDLQKAGVDISKEQYQNLFTEFLDQMAATNGDILSSVESVFGEFLDGTDEVLNAFVSNLGDAFGVGMLDMGQKVESLTNTIDNFFSKAEDWASMSDTEKTEFISDNADLFGGDQGDELYKAFKSQDYARIAAALRQNDALAKRVQQSIANINQELMIERARQGEDRNEAYIQYLEDTLKMLEDTDNLYQASLEIRLEQEQNFLDDYKDYLQQQQEALQDTLEKRRDAYEKYYDDINQQAEDTDYEEQAQLLIANLSKLATSFDPTALTQKAELEQSLKELEEERIQDLRERAQEQVLDNMDTSLDEINAKFDKLLDNNQALLTVVSGQFKEDPAGTIASLFMNKVNQGATALELQDAINSLGSIYAPLLNGLDISDIIQIDQQAGTNNATLNVNGQEVTLNGTEGQEVYNIIMKALRQAGLR